MKHKLVYVFSLIVLCISCNEKKPSIPKHVSKQVSKENVYPKFQKILDSAKLNGSILIYDQRMDAYYSNDFSWAKKGHLPASTFKIPNSIIALENQIIESDTTILPWDGKKRMFKSWEKDLNFTDAIQVSCVPCYQEIARKIGSDRMVSNLEKLDFGDMEVDAKTIDMFWLEGPSKINQFEQIGFLKRLAHSTMDISSRTEQIIKRMLVMKATNRYTLRGKTGWSSDNGHDNGWFVGYVETNDNMLFFAANVEPKSDFDMSNFPRVRKEVTLKALKELSITH